MFPGLGNFFFLAPTEYFYFEFFGGNVMWVLESSSEFLFGGGLSMRQNIFEESVFIQGTCFVINGMSTYT